jgi:hypothetical protein
VLVIHEMLSEERECGADCLARPCVFVSGMKGIGKADTAVSTVTNTQIHSRQASPHSHSTESIA